MSTCFDCGQDQSEKGHIGWRDCIGALRTQLAARDAEILELKEERHGYADLWQDCAAKLNETRATIASQADVIAKAEELAEAAKGVGEVWNELPGTTFALDSMLARLSRALAAFRAAREGVK